MRLMLGKASQKLSLRVSFSTESSEFPISFFPIYMKNTFRKVCSIYAFMGVKMTLFTLPKTFLFAKLYAGT